MNPRHAILGGLALAALTWGTPALAQEGAPPGPPENQRHVQEDEAEGLAALRFDQVDRMAGPLGLSDDQRTRLKKELVTRTREQIRLQGQMQLQRFDLQVLLDEPKPDAEQARRLQDQLQATEAALARNRLDTVLAAKAILTPEQQLKLSAMRPRGGPGAQRPGQQGGPRQQGPRQQGPPQQPNPTPQ